MTNCENTPVSIGTEQFLYISIHLFTNHSNPVFGPKNVQNTRNGMEWFGVTNVLLFFHYNKLGYSYQNLFLIHLHSNWSNRTAWNSFHVKNSFLTNMGKSTFNQLNLREKKFRLYFHQVSNGKRIFDRCHLHMHWPYLNDAWKCFFCKKMEY